VGYSSRNGGATRRPASETPAGMLNAIGLRGIGVHRFVAEKPRNWLGATTIGECLRVDDRRVLRVSRILSDHGGVSAIRLNIVPEHQGGASSSAAASGTDVVSAVRRSRSCR
jgi:hypothetical protein